MFLAPGAVSAGGVFFYFGIYKDPERSDNGLY